jgi:gluconokinase
VARSLEGRYSLQKDRVASSVGRERRDFQKADRPGENPFAKGFSPGTPFPKTPILLRRRDDLATISLTRTPAKEARLGVLCGGAGGRSSCKKEPPGHVTQEKKRSFCKKSLPGQLHSSKTSWFLGIDLGTGSCKAVVVNEKLQPLGFGSSDYASSSVHEKWEEQDPSAVLDGMIRSVHSAIEAAGQLSGKCNGMSIGGALHSLIAVDDHGAPLTGVMTWATGRAARQAEALRGGSHAQELYRQTGCPIHGMYPLYKVLWLREERPEAYKKAAHFLSAKEYVFKQLTGHQVVDYCLAAGSGFLNVHDLRWNNTSLELAGIDASKLSSLCDPGAVFTLANRDLADRMGVPPDTPVTLGTADAVNSSLGAGGVLPGHATCMIGTSGALRIISDKPVLDAKSRTWCYAIDEQHWLVGGAINNGGIALSWLMDLLHGAFPNLPPDMRLSFDDLMSLAARADIGSGGIICLPFFAGERSPKWNLRAKGVFFGLSLDHKMEHLARAVLEGISFRFRSVYDALSEIAGDIRQIRASGGFTHSPFWLQMTADVLNRELAVPVWGETSSLGAALWAIKGADTLSSLEEIEKMVSIGEVCRPEPQSADTYDKVYEVYKELYTAVSPLFQSTLRFR